MLDRGNQGERETFSTVDQFLFSPVSRTTTSEVTSNVRKRSGFAKPKPNLKKILGTKRFGAHQKVPSLFVTKGEEVEIQRGKLYYSLKSYKITLSQEILLSFQMGYSVVAIILTVKKLKHTESRMSYKIPINPPTSFSNYYPFTIFT